MDDKVPLDILCATNKKRPRADDPEAQRQKKRYQCDVCDKSFQQNADLTRHKRTHAGEKPYKCNTCGKSFVRNDNLTIHKRTHTGEKPFKCDGCSAVFANGANLTRHKRTHTGEKAWRCEICDKSFQQHEHLTMHKRTHTGEKPFKCDECSAVFADSKHLTTHKRTHTGEKPYKCGVCDKSFRRNTHLTTHNRIHTGEKPFKCDGCNAAFADRGNLTTHKRIHTGEKPYKCEHCPKVFAHSSNRSQHNKQHEEQQKYIHPCLMQDGGMQMAQKDDIQCIIRCKTQRDLEYHIQRHHTEEGIAAKFKSEQQLAEFFTAKNIGFDRDWLNFISFKHCNGIEGGRSSARPDFYLHAKSAELECVFLVCNDEFAHRQTKCEFQRIFNITQALQQTSDFKDLPIVFVRFNPHFFHVDSKFFDVKLDVAHNQLLNTINAIEKKHLTKCVNLVFVNYDFTDGVLDIFKDAKDDDYATLYKDNSIKF